MTEKGKKPAPAPVAAPVAADPVALEPAAVVAPAPAAPLPAEVAAPVKAAGVERIPVIVGDGSVQTVAPHDLPAALDQGWQVASPEQVRAYRDEVQYGKASAQAQTAGEAALRGLTAGLSDRALTKLGVDAEGMRKRVEQNPVTAGVAEAAGFLAPLALTGGGSGALGVAAEGTRALGLVPRAIAGAGALVEKGVASVAGESILGRGLAKAAAGAAEGGLYGAGQAVSESALQDAPLTAERLAAHVGTGALFGGVAGGVLGGVGASAEKHILPKLKQLLSVENIEAAVNRAGLRQWAQGRGKSMFKKLRRDFGEDAEAAIGRAVQDEGLGEVIANGSTWSEIHGVTQEKLGASGRRIGEALKQVDAALPGEAQGAAQRIAQRTANEVIEPLRNTGLRSDKALAGKLMREAEGVFPTVNAGLEQAVTPATFEQMHKLRARIDDLAFPKGGADPTPYQKSLQKLRGIMEDEITKAADGAAVKMGGEAAAGYSAEKSRYRALKWLNDAAENNAASELSNRTVSLTDNLWGSAITSATLMRLMAGDVSALGSMAIASVAGVGASMTNKMLREQGQGMAARMGQKLLGLVKANEAIAKEADGAVTTFFSRAGDTADVALPVTAARVATPEGMTLAEHYEQRKKRLDDFMLAPDQKLAVALGDTSQTSPALAQEVNAVAQRGASFLASKRPPERASEYDAQPLLASRDRVSDSEKARFVRYADAVEHPRKIVSDLAAGRLSREGAETLRVVYPRLHADIADKVITRLSTSTKRLPRSQLIQLSLLLGVPLDPSMSPKFIARCQAVHAQSKQSAQQQGSRPLPDHSADQQSASQQLEASL